MLRLGFLCAGALACAACLHTGASLRDLDRTVSGRLEMPVQAHLAHDGSDDLGRIDPSVRERLQRPLDADAAMRIAVANNRDLRVQLADLDIASGRVLQASLAPNPVANGSYRVPFGTRTPDAEPRWDFDAGIDLRALILLPGMRSAAIAEYDATRFEVAARVIDAAYRGRIAYLRYVAAHQRTEMFRVAVAATEAGYTAARALAAAGNVPALDVSQQRALFEETRIALARAANDERVLRERANLALGLVGDRIAWRSEDMLPVPAHREPPLDRVETLAVQHSFSLDAAQRRRDAARTRITVARASGWLPALEAGVAIEREDGQHYAGPSLRIGVPLLNQGQGQVAVRYAEAQRAMAEVTATEVRVHALVRAARERVLFGRERVDWYRDTQLPLRGEIVELSQRQYNAMQLGVFQLLQARREQIRAGREYIDALENYWLAQADLARIVAGGDPDPASSPDNASYTNNPGGMQ